ncbi:MULTISPECIES: hypothetical protein [unclassified Rhizobium]|uniref:hypothetical protein n=1 Tax=unclassified Rhizobium TaxID=2613769 RepID=UPI001AE29DC0|nr:MULTISPECIES: hypothetical protein [unclassified Rhizobium]MBP2460180.1 hypothetical protein [Rhizobium sp. PvP014]MBP2531539.1 hypothetical protein [Rhizobium sp. PvP099]
MSSETSTPSARRSAIRYHAVETNTAGSSPCLPHLDPAVLVGLSLAYARQRAAIPAAITVPLAQLADQGDATCRLVVDWLDGRLASACDLDRGPDLDSDPCPGPDPNLDAGAYNPVFTTASSSQVARQYRQRAIDGPRVSITPQPQKVRGRSRSRFAKTAIIAATEENL